MFYEYKDTTFELEEVSIFELREVGERVMCYLTMRSGHVTQLEGKTEEDKKEFETIHGLVKSHLAQRQSFLTQ